MENAINTLRIQNFKSIKDVTMQPRRVNLIIGPPNVGKSNILEAMSLLGGIVYEQTDKFMGSFIRYEEPRQLFYDNLIGLIIKVETDRNVLLIGKSKEDGVFNMVITSFDFFEKVLHRAEQITGLKYIFGDKDEHMIDDFKVMIEDKGLQRGGEYIYTEFNEKGLFGTEGTSRSFKANPGYFSKVAVRPYVFPSVLPRFKEYKYRFLNPPKGDNIINIIQILPELRKSVSKMFNDYGLKLLIRVDERRLEVVKDLEGIIYSYPYSSIADTLQRIIFYLAAIESNDDAVILFEEPEAHSYPQYVSMLGKRIAASRNNQFFVATHSPYLLTEILEQMLPDEEQAAELAIFVAYYEDYQTKVKQLSDEEMRAIRGDSVDVFYNMNRYIPRPANG